jgi:nucleoside-diphosphate-sugar epimerase
VDNGWDVHAISSRTHFLDNPGVTFHRADLHDTGSLSGLISELQASHLLHLAWYTEPGQYWESPENLRWVKGTLGLLDLFQGAGGKHVVAAGSCAEYDWNYGYCREDITPLGPATVYGRCKHNLHQLMEVYSRLHGVRVAWGRVFFLYGPYEARGRLVPSVITALLRGDIAQCSTGSQFRDFLHVSDVAAAFVALLESDLNGPVNISSGRPTSVRELVEAIAGGLGKSDRVSFGALPTLSHEPAFLVGCNQRLIGETDWRPQYDIATGVGQVLDWWSNSCPDYWNKEI